MQIGYSDCGGYRFDRKRGVAQEVFGALDAEVF
jgi:hypothetical protein